MEVTSMGVLLEAIAEPVNLVEVWAQVRANRGAGGVDGQTIAVFEADAQHQLAALRRRLLSPERYVPPPVRRVEIPKPDGRTRPLGIPTVADRVVQQSVVQVIGPAFEARFLPCSFGYRPGRNAQAAVWWVTGGSFDPDPKLSPGSKTPSEPAPADTHPCPWNR